jgi:hypothetical protein
MPPIPGWFARRRRDLPPARDVLAGLPAGPAVRHAAAERERVIA